MAKVMKTGNEETDFQPEAVYSEFLKVYEAATPEEKKQLDPIRLRKRDALLKRGKRTEVTQAEIQ